MDARGPSFHKGQISQLDALDQFQIVHLLLHPKNWRTIFIGIHTKIANAFLKD